ACGDATSAPPPEGATPEAGAGDDGPGGTSHAGGGGDDDVSQPDSGPALPLVPDNGPIPLAPYTIYAAGSGKCLDGPGATAGAAFQQKACSGAPTQTFDVIPVAGKYLRIVDVSTGFGIDVKDKSKTPGTAIQQWMFYGNLNQEVLAEPKGNGNFALRLR